MIRKKQRDLEPLLLSFPDAGAYLGVPPETVRSWCKRGIFRVIRIGRRSLLLKRELDEFVRRQIEG